jgi:hypothetical protein
VIAGPTMTFNFVSDDADVCGVDEAGRGPLAGPERLRLGVEIRRKAKAFAVAEVGAEHAR